MAISKSLIHRGLNGSMGGLTFCTQKDRVIVKEAVKEVRNPNTEKQQEQRKALSRTVIAWQIVGMNIKSGITQISKYGNPYSTFVSNNINFNKTTNITKENFKNEMLKGLTVSIGNIAPVKVNEVVGNAQNVIVKVDLSDQLAGLKEDDKICILVGSKQGKGMKRKDIFVKDLQGTGAEKSATFKHGFAESLENGVISVWFENAKGTASSTSKLMLY